MKYAPAKTCTKCGKTKPLTAFNNHKTTRDGLRPDCMTCVQTRMREYYHANADANRVLVRGRGIRKRYGITVDQWDQLFTQQGKCCAICKSVMPQSTRGWHTDHTIVAGRIKVRGILCQPCNLALGFYERDRPRFAAFDAYLGDNNG
jgi:hypothetical protein